MASEGRWRITLQTEIGSCPKRIETTAFVRKGDIEPDAGGALKASGAFDTGEAMWARLTRGKELYRLQGRIGRGRGKGAWSSNTQMCGGTWMAVRMR